MTAKYTQVLKELRSHLETYLGNYEMAVLEIKDKGRKTPDIDITIYRKDGKIIGTEDCRIANRLAEEYLDKSEKFPEKYKLSVSSPGLDRVLKEDYDWKYAVGKMVNIKFKTDKGEILKYIGVLDSIKDNEIIIRNKTDNSKIKLEHNKIKKARLYFDWGGKKND